MLTYTTLQDRTREFLAATGLTHSEFARVLPAFAAAYALRYPPDKTWEGKARQRQSGGGAKGVLSQLEDKLLFILVYQKTNPLQTMHGLQFDLSQPQTHYWIHRLLPVLRQALATLGMAPERDASRVATSPLMLEGAPAGAVARLRPRQGLLHDLQLRLPSHKGRQPAGGLGLKASVQPTGPHQRKDLDGLGQPLDRKLPQGVDLHQPFGKSQGGRGQPNTARSGELLHA